MENKPQKIREIEELLGFTLREVKTQGKLMDWESSNSYLLNVNYEIIGLNLCYNQIQDISFLQGLINLQSLDLGGNEIQDISFLQGLNHLQRLNLSHNEIQDISFLQGLNHLQRLNLSHNQIQDFSFLQGLNNLQTLYLGSNQIQDISFLQGLNNLYTLDLRHNQIQDYSFLQGLNNLHTLNLSNNQIQDYSFLQGLKNLQRLDLSDNEIQDYSFLQGLNNLEILELSGNKISDYSFLEGLHNLKTLELINNEIQDISFLQGLRNLQILNLGANQIQDISFLQGLSNLQILSLSSNEIQEISFLKELSNLEVLDIGTNQIQDFSLSFLNNFPKLILLNIADNPLPQIPKEIIRGYQHNCLPALRTYLEDLENGAEKNNEVKVILIGNGSVGKTQIAKRFVEGKDYVFDTQYHSTHGIVLMQRRIACALLAEQGLVLNIWDFAGQDLYHATHRLFMRTQAVFVLVWDFENEYEQTQHIYKGKAYDNQKLSYWLEYARCFGKDSPILVLQNKVDLGEKRMEKQHKKALQATYPIHDFLEVSAFSGKGFVLLEEKIAEIFEQNKQFADDLLKELPSSWVKVRKKIRNAQAAGIKEIDFASFQASCAAQGIENSAAVLLEFLHNTGVLYYKQAYFDGRIILNQAWAIEAIYQILDRDSPYFEVLEHQEGKISYKDLGKIWKSHSESEKELFMGFMLSCELCFETTPNKKHDTPLSARTFIVPQLLSATKPPEIAYFYEEKASEKRALAYRFLPTIFMHRLIVKAHHLAEVAEMWQAGIVIKENADSFAIVIADYKSEPQSITIQYSPQSKKLAEAIIETLKEIEGEGEVKPQKSDTERLEILKGEAYLKSLKTTYSRFSIAEIREFIVKDKLKEAIAAMRGTAADNVDFIALSAHLFQLENEQIQGTIFYENYNLERAKIRQGLLQFLRE